MNARWVDYSNPTSAVGLFRCISSRSLRSPSPYEVLYCIDLPPCLYVTQGHVYVRQECVVCKWDFEVESRALYNMPVGYCMFELHRHILSRHINDLDKAAY